MEIPPLTLCNKKGVPYQRTQVVTLQIQSVLRMPEVNLLERIQIMQRDDQEYLQEECIVHLIRRCHRQGRKDIVELLSEILLRRSVQYIRSKLKPLGSDRTDDACNEVIANLFERILDTNSDRADFLEVRYWSALQRQVITTFRKYVKQKKRDKRLIPLTWSIGDDDEPLHEEQSTSIPEDASPGLTQDEGVILQEALAALSEPHRTAFLLRHYIGMKIESKNPSDDWTISKKLNRTGRTIRTWLKEAEEQLESWRRNDERA